MMKLILISKGKFSCGGMPPRQHMFYILSVYKIVSTSRPESNVLKILPKMLSGISQIFHLLYSLVLSLCLHYAPKLATFLTSILEHFNQ